MRGKAHASEPEVDSLSYIDFEPEAADGNPDPYPGTWAPQFVIDAWFIRTAALVARDFDLVETRFEDWDALEKALNEAGYDTYNSDTRFEVFDGGQTCGNPAGRPCDC